MIIITRSNGIYSSPRIEKYIDFFEKEKIKYLVIGWDRKGENLHRKNTLYYRKNTGYNIGGFKASYHRILWMLFLVKTFYRYRKDIKTIHAFDLDTAYPATLFKFLFHCKIKIIFDVCDWFSSNFDNEKSLIKRVFKIMEKFTIKYSDEVIICEPERIRQIPYKLNKPELVVPNTPSFTNYDFLQKNEQYQFKNSMLVLSYVGGFSKSRLLNELIKLVQKNKINLLIAGFGDKYIENKCIQLQGLPNFKYFGKVKYLDGLNIMFNSDLIYAMYSSQNSNNRYAAPNKYYEAMLLGKPILTNKGTIMTEKIIKNNIGYVVSENYEDIELLLLSLNLKDVQTKGNIAKQMWDNTYNKYFENFMKNKYINLIS